MGDIVPSIPGYTPKPIFKFEFFIAEMSEYKKCLLSCKTIERVDLTFGISLKGEEFSSRGLGTKVNRSVQGDQFLSNLRLSEKLCFVSFYLARRCTPGVHVSIS